MSAVRGAMPHTILNWKYLMSDLSQRRLDRGNHLLRIRRNVRLEARQNMPVRTNQKFREVPLNFAARLWMRGFVGKELVQRRFVAAFNAYFRHHRKSYVVFARAERFDFL